MKRIALLLIVFSFLFIPATLSAQSKKSRAKSNTDPTLTLSKKSKKVRSKVVKSKGGKSKKKKSKKAAHSKGNKSQAQLWIREEDLEIA